FFIQPELVNRTLYTTQKRKTVTSITVHQPGVSCRNLPKKPLLVSSPPLAWETNRKFSTNQKPATNNAASELRAATTLGNFRRKKPTAARSSAIIRTTAQVAGEPRPMASNQSLKSLKPMACNTAMAMKTTPSRPIRFHCVVLSFGG